MTPSTHWHVLQATLITLSQDRRQNTACTVLLCQWPAVWLRQTGHSTAQVNGWIQTVLRGSEHLIECNECASALVLFDLNAAQIEAVSARIMAALAPHGVSAQVSTAQRVSGEPEQSWLRRLGVGASRSNVLEATQPAPPPKGPAAQMPAPSGSHRVGHVFRDAPFAPEMVVLPGGKFLMGSRIDEPSWYEDQDPQHEVTIAYQLAMGKYPVTFDEWDACVADRGTTYVPDDEGWGRGKQPVIQVCWSHAQQYVAWLNKKLGMAADALTRYRLPSEAEWEYACRAGTQGMYSTPDGLMSAGRANYDASETFEGAPKVGHMPGKTTPVGTYPANPWGLYDMHGNVWEWMQDWYHWGYRGAPVDGSAWEEPTLHYALRGGAWDTHPQNLCSSYRLGYDHYNHSESIGFRVVRTVLAGT